VIKYVFCISMKKAQRHTKSKILWASLNILGFLLTIGTPSYSRGEIFVGYNSGINIPGAQDLKFKEYNSQGELIHFYLKNDIDGKIGFLNSLNISAWGTHDFWQNIGIQLDALYWRLTTKANGFSKNNAPPFTSIEQDRTAFFVNILRRLPVYNSGNFSSIQRQTYIFGGVGAGPLYTNVQHGQHEWKIGFQILGGISIPLHQNVHFRIESRYLLAPDADTIPQTGWEIDTSGTPTPFRFNPHLDTNFVGVMVGVDWQLR
jgi:opacity protein-like surface antigen